jgi:membrane-associated phospholipid phosphatase
MSRGLSIDGAVQAWVLAHQYRPLHQLFFWITNAGGITAMKVLAALGGVYLWYRGRRVVGLGVMLIPFITIPLFNVLKRVYARPRPRGLPGGGAAQLSDSSFPSGHATTSVAVCCTLAYVFWREGFVGRTTAILVAVLVPFVAGLSRVYLDVHWATDVLGGWCLGLLIAGLSVVLYDRYGHRASPSPHDSMQPPAA